MTPEHTPGAGPPADLPGASLPATRAALLVLGAWFALSVAMAYTAGSNFAVVDPERLRDAASIYADIPEGERRMALRYVASELNRHGFAAYDKANVALAALALGLATVAGRARGWRGWALAVCLLLAVLFAAVITPRITDMGRAIDFVPRDPPPPEVEAFYVWHRITMAIELTKLALIALVATSLVRASPQR